MSELLKSIAKTSRPLPPQLTRSNAGPSDASTHSSLKSLFTNKVETLSLIGPLKSAGVPSDRLSIAVSAVRTSSERFWAALRPPPPSSADRLRLNVVFDRGTSKWRLKTRYRVRTGPEELSSYSFRLSCVGDNCSVIISDDIANTASVWEDDEAPADSTTTDEYMVEDGRDKWLPQEIEYGFPNDAEFD